MGIRRRPRRHKRETASRVIIVNSDISYDHVSGVQLDRERRSSMNEGLHQVEENEAVLELEQVVLGVQQRRKASEQRRAEEERKATTRKLNELEVAKAELEKDAAKNASDVFGGISAEATFDVDSFATEFIDHSYYDLGPHESPSDDMSMSGVVRLGSGEHKIELRVSSESSYNLWKNTSTPVTYRYFYKDSYVHDPEMLYELIRENRKR